MKRILLAIAAAAILFVSCDKKEKTPTAEFGQNFYTVYAQSEIQIDIVLSQAATQAINIPVLTSGTAIPGIDFEITQTSIAIHRGETQGSFTLRDLGLTADKSVTLTLGSGSGFNVGTKYVTVVSLDSKERLIYSFQSTEAVVLESYIVTLALSGTESGDAFQATEVLQIPLCATGNGASRIKISPVQVNAGQNKGTAVISLADNAFSGTALCELTVDPSAKRYLPGELPTLLLQVRGLQTPEKLLGTWKFSHIYDLEDVELFFLGEDDDPEKLPTQNENFTLTFTKAGNDMIVTPGGTGDFLKFFRPSKVSLTTPKHLVAGGFLLGNYSTEEANMFIAAEAETYQQNTYYLLERANLAFSADKEETGSAIVVFRITPDGDLCVEFREYNNADKFGPTWWGEGDKFDPEMFGFATLVKKAE